MNNTVKLNRYGNPLTSKFNNVVHRRPGVILHTSIIPVTQ